MTRAPFALADTPLADVPLTRAPSESVREMIDRIHEPEGAGPAVVIEAAAEH